MAKPVSVKPMIPRPDAATAAEKKRIAPKCIIMNTAERARRELGLDRLPEHIKLFGEFMLEQQRRDLTPRDVVKAYVLTRSSVRRFARTPDTIRAGGWVDHPFTGETRPEDAMAYLLQTRDGKTYLDSAQTGILSDDAVHAAARMTLKFRPFGMDRTLFDDMTKRAPLLAEKTTELAKVLRTGSRDEWFAFADKNIWGIKAAKSGFIAALLGRGDIPTADSRELIYWWTNRDKFTEYEQDKLAMRFVRRLIERLREMKVDVPYDLAPFYQHLVHHAVWDATSGTQTTHADVVSCLRFAGVA
jgi:hypothetical protein